MSNNKLGIYCRVSSKKQMDNTSLNNQKEKGIDYLKKMVLNMRYLMM